MSFPKYPKYKDSGVEWLGEVPEHWHHVRVKNIFAIGRGRVISLDDANENGTYPVFSSQTTNNGCLGFIETFDFDCEQITWTTDGANAGTVFLRKGKHNCTNVCGTLQVKSAADYSLNFGLHYLSFATQFYKRPDTNGAKIMNGEMAEIAILVPPPEEQTTIATFLDQETAKIDTLVSEQKRLIELLKEKRQAVISHAVTKGLNPEVPMKDSGVEWLGEVPEHWEVLPLKRLVSSPITDGPHETPKFIDHGVPFISAEAISSGSIDFSKIRACISEEDNTRYSLKYSPKLHDIYMIKSGATTGITAIVEDRIDFNIWSPLAAIRCNSGSIPHFVLNFMRSRHFLEAVTLYWSFGTQQNIGMGVIENLFCTVPPLEEQVVIAQHLTRESAKIDTLTTEAHRAIALLQERRTALISAAVTGQIDVRNYVNKAVL